MQGEPGYSWKKKNERKKDFSNRGLGYIDSHTVVELINEGFEVVIVDDLRNAEYSIYGQPGALPVTERTAFQQALWVYGSTK